MKSCNCEYNCSRNSIIFLNVIYLVFSLILIGIAAYGKATAFITDISVLSGIVICGAILLIIAIIGIVATILHHNVALFFYMILLGLLFLVQISLSCTALALNPPQQAFIFEEAWNKTSYNLKKTMQNRYHCCGLSKAYMNETIYPNSTLPSSGHPTCDQSLEIHCKNGNETINCNTCWEKVEESVNKGLKAGGTFGLLSSFIELLGLVLVFRFRRMKPLRKNVNNSFI